MLIITPVSNVCRHTDMRFREQQSHTSETSISRICGTVTFTCRYPHLWIPALFTLTLIRKCWWNDIWIPATGWYGITLQALSWLPPNWPVHGETRRCGGCTVSCRCHVTPGAGCWLCCTGRRNRERWNADKSRPPVCLRYGWWNDCQHRTGAGGRTLITTPAVSR